MRVLHVLPAMSISNGGPPVSVAGLASGLIAAGHQAVVFATDAATPPQAHDVRGGVSSHELVPGACGIDLSLFPLRSPKRLAFAPGLLRALHRRVDEFDLVHIHSLYLFPQAAAYLMASLHGVPYIVSPRGALDPYLRQNGILRKRLVDVLWQRRMLQSAAAIHLTSDDERALIEPLGFQSPQVVAPNGLDVKRLTRPILMNAFRDRYLAGYQGAVILNHGRIARKKGLDLLIRAVALLDEGRLVIVGPDDEGIGSELSKLALELGIAHRVTIVDALAGNDLLAAIDTATVWALPSHSENFGMAVVEAMGRGRAVVTSPHVNIAQEASLAGALIMVDNEPSAVAAAIAELLDNSVKRGCLEGRARQYVQRFDWSVITQDYVAIYEDAIDQERRPAHG